MVLSKKLSTYLLTQKLLVCTGQRPLRLVHYRIRAFCLQSYRPRLKGCSAVNNVFSGIWNGIKLCSVTSINFLYGRDEMWKIQFCLERETALTQVTSIKIQFSNWVLLNFIEQYSKYCFTGPTRSRSFIHWTCIEDDK